MSPSSSRSPAVCAGDGHGRHVVERLEPGGECQADQLGRAHHVRTEQLVVRQHVVDQRGRVHDQVDAVGQPVPGGFVEAEVGFADIAGKHLEVLFGQSRGSGAISSASPLSNAASIALPGTGGVASPGYADQPAAVAAPTAPASPAPGTGRGNRSRRSAAPCALRRSGAAASLASLSVCASTNLSRVRSPAYTSLLSRPCTDA